LQKTLQLFDEALVHQFWFIFYYLLIILKVKVYQL